MSFFQWLKLKVAPYPVIEHSIFGRLQATIRHDDGTFYWESEVATPKGNIEVFFDAPVAGPSDAQIRFWNWIRENHERLAESARNLLLDALQTYDLEHRFAFLVWNGVELPVGGDRNRPWDMSFHLGDREGALLSLSFENGIPMHATLDGF